MSMNKEKKTKKMLFTLSSWNYGSYCMNNPCYISVKTSQDKCNENNEIKVNRNTEIPTYRYGKRFLKEEERIVTNEIMESLNHYNEMQKCMKKGMFRTKSANGLRYSKNDEEDMNIKQVKLNSGDYKYRLSFGEWLQIKKKQYEIINNIKNRKMLENLKVEEENKQINIKYNELKEKKYKEWLNKKNKESREKKLKVMEEEYKKEEERKSKEVEKERIMSQWFKKQAEIMEKDIIKKREESKKKREEEKLKKSEEIIKRKKIKKEFEKWKKRKDFEMKKKVQNEKRIKQMENEKKRYSGTPNKKFPIGPYTDAKAIKEMQTYLIGKINKGYEEKKNSTRNQVEENGESSENNNPVYYENESENDNYNEIEVE